MNIKNKLKTIMNKKIGRDGVELIVSGSELLIGLIGFTGAIDANPWMDRPIHSYLGINTTEYFNKTEFDFSTLLMLSSIIRPLYRDFIHQYIIYKDRIKSYKDKREG